ncbi:hypothetical protein Fcan01_24070 [Folsomia candida]|uniref:Uncharacterized protein n=1 Tax=Folsomia candida TaxID=158441 RepID=A0A226D7U5_FOLCA|nr:hypothetical protein Fcan01_24070 [Folsomia candida]
MFEPPTKVTPRDERHKVQLDLPESTPISKTSKSIQPKPLQKLKPNLSPTVDESRPPIANKKDKQSRRHKHKHLRNNEAIVECETVLESSSEWMDNFLQSSATSIAQFDKNGPQPMETGTLSPTFPLEPMEITLE